MTIIKKWLETEPRSKKPKKTEGFSIKCYGKKFVPESAIRRWLRKIIDF